ncbi:MAG: FHA domain-containing protein [Anaerolineales bacterium]|nr:FHA domain-containing protein [Anaerolineales bacterium]MCB8953811.1 FHA domain-containing protein [Ardenticatenales bacterium]
MDLLVVLFALRLLGALLLLAFLGGIAWIVYQDMRVVETTMSDRQRRYGYLRVVGSLEEMPARDTLFPLLPITSLGRSPNNTIVLRDNYASSEHALITLRGQQWWLEDLGSRNGTRLNNLPVTGATVISAGDVVMIGNVQLKIELSG